MAKNKRYTVLFEYFRRHLKNLLRNYFIWEGLPETIDSRALEEMLLFESGHCIGFKWTEAKDPDYKDKVIVADGALAGIDLYQRPVQFVSANPVIVPAVLRTVGKDCVPLFNTRNYRFGETCNQLVNMYADLLAHQTISMKTSIVNSRVVLIPTVKDDKEAIRVNELLQQIYDGESYALKFKISEFDGNTIFPIKARDNIVVSELADARRCIFADFYAESGVKTVAVDKRERTNLAEMSSNDTQTKIACDIMLSPRQMWAEEMNKMFGTNISVRFNEDVMDDNVIEEVLNYGESMGETDANNGATA